MLKINMFFKVDKAAFLKQREQEKEFWTKKSLVFHQNFAYGQLSWNVLTI